MEGLRKAIDAYMAGAKVEIKMTYSPPPITNEMMIAWNELDSPCEEFETLRNIVNLHRLCGEKKWIPDDLWPLQAKMQTLDEPFRTPGVHMASYVRELQLGREPAREPCLKSPVNLISTHSKLA